MQPIRVELELGGRTLSIETGKLAKQADGAVVVQYGETMVLGTVVRDKPRPDIDFFPLTVDYREKLSAAGKFPGGFRKREGAPNTKEILTMRNIDRPIRPLFPKGFFDEVQIQCWVLSADGQNEPDVLAGIAAQAALTISSVPYLGPTGSVRVARIDGQFVVMPTAAQMDFSDFELLLSGHRDGINMIEVGAHELSEDVVAEGIEFGYKDIIRICDALGELQKKAGKEKYGDLRLPADDIVALVDEKLAGPLKAAKTIDGTKLERQEAVKEAINSFIEAQFPEPGEDATYRQVQNWQKRRSHAKMAVHDLEERITKEVIREGQRTDGRAMNEIRDLAAEVGLLPRAHGSALFTRGETQALVTAVLGTNRDEQIIDGLADEYREKFYLHYNFPPFSVGEAKRISGPGRREIGHGKLAEKALIPVLPPVTEFPYTVRLVSDILESNGSSSMASTCGGSLALLNAGVPIKASVAGISIGMVGGEGDHGDLYLTDIQGEEDHFCDMDFKVTGTRDGITAIQLDLKMLGLNMTQVREAFKHARDARLKILDVMNATISEPGKLSPHAPRLLTTQIDPDKIGKLIGPGGKTIRAIQEATGATIEVEEDGTVIISAVGGGRAEAALEEVEKLCADVKVGQIYSGTVTTIRDFGAFIEVIPGQDGLCHISELAEGYVQKVTDIVSVGQSVRVKVINIDDQGRVKLSMKAVAKDSDKEEDEASIGAS